MKQLTVGQLIERLKKFPLDALVAVEGCDCIGECVACHHYRDPYHDEDEPDSYVLIERDPISRNVGDIIEFDQNRIEVNS